MTFDFRVVLSEYLRGLGIPNDGVVAYTQETVYGGYCDTCSYESIQIGIVYRFGGATIDYIYYGDMAQLICELSDE